eukprot:7017833-Lingulodinium_polyedra.AAC.1
MATNGEARASDPAPLAGQRRVGPSPGRSRKAQEDSQAHAQRRAIPHRRWLSMPATYQGGPIPRPARASRARVHP